MVRNGPDSIAITEYAAESSALPYCSISDIYSPPLVSLTAATTASADRPASPPVRTGSTPSRWPSNNPAASPNVDLAASSAPPLRTTCGSERTEIFAPMQT
jgi:hypothetical protein